MLTFVRDHGEWFAYTPKPWPDAYPARALFTRRESDPLSGCGWYDYIKADPFRPTSLKIVLTRADDAWIAQVVSRDPTTLFPQDGAKVVEFDDGETTPIEPWSLDGKVYDSENHTLNDPPPPEPQPSAPSTITRRQLLLALMGAGIITSEEALAAAKTGDVPTAIADMFNTLSEPERTAAYITWASMSVAERSNPLVAMLAASQDMDDEAVDAFFRTAASL